MMTSRERWLALLTGHKPDHIPTDYWATQEVTDCLLRDLRCADVEALYRNLHIDAVRSIGAPLQTRHRPDDPEADIFGVRRRRVDYGAGAYDEAVGHPLAGIQTVGEVHAFRWPTPDYHDFDAFRRQVRDLPDDRAVRCGGYEPFLLYCHMRGMEQALMDLLIAPEIADAALSHIFDYHYGLLARMFEIGQGRIDITYVAEDLGTQHGLMMSREQIHRFILPNQKRIADLARSFGIHIFYHTDGAVSDVIGDLIDVTGIEILNPIQWRCPGMDRRRLVRDFGDRIIFHGAMDNQQTLAFGTPDDVRHEVLENIVIFAWPARWICAPCHNLQSVSPTANIVALYQTIYENGRL